MKRRKSRVGALNMGGIGDTLMQGVLPAAAGFVVGKILTKQLTFLSSNPSVGNLAKIAGGVLLAGQRGFLAGIGVGIAAEGAVGFIQPALETSGIALLPPGVPSRWLAGLPQNDIVPAGNVPSPNGSIGF